MGLQALNSERFRHRFLERNRPWILQHLVELLTPRSLEQPGHDGRPVVEYVRDVYAELMAMGEGTRKPGDRDDISSDDEECDAAEKKERDEEGAASSATLAKHRDILDSIDQEIEGAREAVEKQRKAYEGEQRGFFDR